MAVGWDKQQVFGRASVTRAATDGFSSVSRIRKSVIWIPSCRAPASAMHTYLAHETVPRIIAAGKVRLPLVAQEV